MKRREIYEAACETLAGEGWEASVRPDYSGRGMFGQTTPAIVTGAPGAMVGWAISRVLVESDPDDGSEGLDEALRAIPKREDAMGRDTVYY